VPRYLVESPPFSPVERERLLALAAHRYPEVAVEHCFAGGDDPGIGDVWVCRATSPVHLERWARAGGLALRAVRRIEYDAAIVAAQGGDRS
jgi:hypothetical protein